MQYIYQQTEWPNFTWDPKKIAELLAEVHHRLGRLIGRMETLGFDLRNEAMLRTMTLEVLKNSEIENEKLDPNQVRSSVARRLGMDIGGLVHSDRNVEGAVEIMLDAIQHFEKTLTKKRLLDWHAALFPTARSGMNSILVGEWRDDRLGPMQVLSGPIGKERVHFKATAAANIEKEMQTFLHWFNGKHVIDPVIKAGIAHLWFVTIHPFEDGNGRLARTITDLQLARADGSMQRFYSISAQINLERSAYYKILERTQKDDLNITNWLEWFLNCIIRALSTTEINLNDVLNKAQFWERHRTEIFNERQRVMLNKLLDGTFIGKLTSSKWAKMTKISQDTASRDIQNLIERNILVKEAAGGRSTSYVLDLK